MLINEEQADDSDKTDSTLPYLIMDFTSSVKAVNAVFVLILDEPANVIPSRHGRVAGHWISSIWVSWSLIGPCPACHEPP